MTSPRARFRLGLFHFARCWSVKRYSLFQRVQNKFATYCTLRQRHLISVASVAITTVAESDKGVLFDYMDMKYGKFKKQKNI